MFNILFTQHYHPENSLINSNYFTNVSIEEYKLLVRNYHEENLIKQDNKFSLFLIGNPIRLLNFNLNLENLDLSKLIEHNQIIFNLFETINGIGIFILLDEIKLKIHFITDPMGYFPLFHFESNGCHYISDSTRAIGKSCSEKAQWNGDSIQNFYNNGHFVNRQSWFLNFAKTLPASIYTLNLKEESWTQKYYWTWESVQVLKNNNKDNLLQYTNAFESLFQNIDYNKFTKPVGVALSGGLDSRWVADNLVRNTSNVEAFTFADRDGPDCIIASRIAKELKIPWLNINISYSDWFNDRLEAFWASDGLIPIHQFHEGNIYADLNYKYGLIATGFYGGGIYASSDELNQRVDARISHKFFKTADTLIDISEPYFNLNSIDPYISFQRIANLSALHVYTLSKYIKVLIPFYNLNWLIANYSTDDKLQINHRFYLRALNQSMSKKLLELPWQKTGLAPKNAWSNSFLLSSGINKLYNKMCDHLGLGRSFVHYELLDSELNRVISILEKFDLVKHLEPKSIEQKFRLASILLWYNMYNNNTHRVI